MSVRILQLSDTHFRIAYDDELMAMGIDYSPVSVFTEFLEHHDFLNYDAVVITGDLVHEGSAADYQAYQQLLEKYIPSETPIYYCLGNHDRRAAFYEGMHLAIPPREQIGRNQTETRYDYATSLKGYRLIVLDNYDPITQTEMISDEQYMWFKQELDAMQEEYALVFMHHPIDIRINEQFDYTILSESMRNALSDPRILGVFTGHVHMNQSTMLKSTPEWTCLSCYAGFHAVAGTNYFNDYLGYNAIDLNQGNIRVSSDLITPIKTNYRPMS